MNDPLIEPATWRPVLTLESAGAHGADRGVMVHWEPGQIISASALPVSWLQNVVELVFPRTSARESTP